MTKHYTVTLSISIITGSKYIVGSGTDNRASIIRECDSTLYVESACTALPTNTNFRLTFY